jgi:lipoprotein-anchoring transpeptidase ErfK/SrfK
MRSRARLSAAVLATAVGVTGLAGIHAESRGAALTSTSTGSAPPAATVHAGARDRVSAAAVAATVRPTVHHHSAQVSPCARNRRPKLVAVSIERQYAWACAGHRTVLSTAVTTGASTRTGDATPRGSFAVEGTVRNTVLTTSATGRYHVKYWIPFHVGIWGFHDASWQTMPFGSRHYVQHGSHGCVHMPLAAIRWLFHWVHYGTPVRIT